MANIKPQNALIFPFSHPAACSDTEVGGKPPCFDFSAGCSSEHPQLPWLLFSFHLFFWFWKTGSFPLLSAPIHISVIKRPTWQFYNDKRHPSKMFSFTGAWHGCQTPREKLFSSFPSDPAWVLGLWASRYLVQLGKDGAGPLLLLIFLHLGLQALVVLQCLLPSLHCHVQAGKHTAEPGERMGRGFGWDILVGCIIQGNLPSWKSPNNSGFRPKIPRGLNKAHSKHKSFHCSLPGDWKKGSSYI